MEEITLEWTGEDLEFVARKGDLETAIDGRGKSAPNPVSLLLEAVAACMAIDIVDILKKGRQDVRGLHVRTRARRMDDPPRYVRWLSFDIEVEGPVDQAKADRAARLSFDRYCSVFHSLRDDMEVESNVRVVDGSAGTDVNLQTEGGRGGGSAW